MEPKRDQWVRDDEDHKRKTSQQREVRNEEETDWVNEILGGMWN